MGRFFEMALMIVSMAVLGRMLTPEDFGIFGIILAVQALLLPFLDFGLKTAFIKLEEADNEIANLFFTMNLGFGILISSILIVTAPLLAYTYDHSILLPLMLSFAPTILIRSLAMQPIAHLNRQKRFGGTTLARMAGVLSGSVAAIMGAWIGLGVWSFIIRAFVHDGMMCAIVHRLSKVRYNIVSLHSLRKGIENLRFGGEIVASRLLAGALGSVDRLLFGRFYSTQLLGFYTKAVDVATLPDKNIRTALSTPALAHLSRLPDRRLRDGYILLHTGVLFVAGLPCVICIIAGDRLLPLLMGSQWVDAGIYLQILGILGLGRLLFGLVTIMHINEKSMPRLWRIYGSAIVFTLALPLLVAWLGAEAMTYTYTLSTASLAFWVVVSSQSLRLFTGSWKAPWQVGWFTFVMILPASIAGLVLRLAISPYLGNTQTASAVLVAIVTIGCLTAAVAAQWILNRSYAFELCIFLRDGLFRRSKGSQNACSSDIASQIGNSPSCATSGTSRVSGAQA